MIIKKVRIRRLKFLFIIKCMEEVDVIHGNLMKLTEKGNTNEIKNQLLKIENVCGKLNKDDREKYLRYLDIERIIGEAIFKKDYITIALINIFIRTIKYRLNKEEIIKQIYHAECRQTVRESEECCLSFLDFEELEDRNRYDKYYSWFEEK